MASQVIKNIFRDYNWDNLFINKTLTLGNNAAFIINSSNTSIFTSSIQILAITNQIILGTGNTTTINVNTPSSSRIYTIPDARQNCNIISQSINDGLTNASTRPPINGGTALAGSFEIRGYSSSGLFQDDGFLRLRAGGGTNAGASAYIDISGYSTVSDMNNNLVFGTTGVERMRIDVNGQTTFSGTANQLVFQPIGGNQITFSISPPAASQRIRFLDPGATANVLYDVQSQTISGIKTFSSAPNFSFASATSLLATDGSKNVTSTTNSITPTLAGITLQTGSSGNTTTINQSNAPATSQTLQIYDFSAQSTTSYLQSGVKNVVTLNSSSTNILTTGYDIAPSVSGTLFLIDMTGATGDFSLNLHTFNFVGLSYEFMLKVGSAHNCFINGTAANKYSGTWIQPTTGVSATTNGTHVAFAATNAQVGDYISINFTGVNYSFFARSANSAGISVT